MPTKPKTLGVNLKPIAAEIENAKKSLSGLRTKISSADKAKLNLKIKQLDNAIKAIKRACGDKKMTAGFSPR